MIADMINLHNYQWSKNLSEYFGTLLTQDLSGARDVTIVTDNHHKISAHKFVLQIGSLFFRDLLSSDGASSCIVYLRGVDRVTMEHILGFIYTGKATIPQHDLEQFIKVSNELKIIGIFKPISDETPTILSEKEKQSCYPIYSDISKEIVEPYVNMSGNSEASSEEANHHYDSMIHIYNNIENEEEINHIQQDEVANEHGQNGLMNSESNALVCDLCDKEFKSKSNFRLHRYKFHTREKILQKSLIAMT